MEQKKTLNDRIADVKKIEAELQINNKSFSIPIETFVRKPQVVKDEIMAYRTPVPTAIDTPYGVKQVDKGNWIAVNPDGTQEVYTGDEFIARFDLKPVRGA